MFNSAVKLTFPCPTCGGFLTLRTFQASGPCPACDTHLEVRFQIHSGTGRTGLPPRRTVGKNYEKRRFRPSPQVTV